MLRILHVVPSYYPAIRYGGPIRSVHGLAAAQVAIGHQVSVFTTNVDGPGVSHAPLDKPVIMDGVAVHYFAVPMLKRLYWSPSMAAMLRERIERFDIVHLHSVFLWPTFAAARIASAAGVPYVLAPRGSLVRQLINSKSRWLKRAWINMVEKVTIKYSAGLHVTTALEANDVQKLRLPVARYYCVPNGITLPTRVIPFEQSRFADFTTPYVLYVGRLNWKKGLDRLIEAWVEVPDKLNLVLAGNDEDEYRCHLQELAKRKGIAQRVIFLGQVSDEDKWTLYKQAKLFVLPSSSENFGNVVIEAMAMACPVLVTPGVGLAELVHREQCGIVVDNDPQRLATEITRIASDPESARMMGERGRSVVVDSFTWSSVAKQMDHAYEEALATHSLKLAKA